MKRNYVVHYTLNGPCATEIAAKDKKDATEFVRKTYKGATHIKAKLAPGQPKLGRGRKLDKMVEDKGLAEMLKSERVLSVDEVMHQQMEQAKALIRANPYNGLAIGRYLDLVLREDPYPYNIKAAVEFVVRAVRNYQETFIQKKY